MRSPRSTTIDGAREADDRGRRDRVLHPRAFGRRHARGGATTPFGTAWRAKHASIRTTSSHAWLAALDPARACRDRSGRPVPRLACARGRAGRPRHAPHGAAPRTLPTLKSRGIAVRKLYLDTDAAELAGRIERARRRGCSPPAFSRKPSASAADAVAADAVGYREALAYLRGWSTAAELREQLIRTTRRYAKRQATWFRTEPGLRRACLRRLVPRCRGGKGKPGWA